MRDLGLSAHDRELLSRAIETGLDRAVAGLATMTNRAFRHRTLRVAVLPVTEIESQLPPPGERVVAVYLWLSLAFSAHILFILEPPKARELIDILLEVPTGTTGEFDSLAISAIGEVGNQMGADFAHALSDLCGKRVNISTPEVKEEMLGAVMDSIFAELGLNSDLALLIESALEQDDRHVQGLVVVLPEPTALPRFVAALERS